MTHDGDDELGTAAHASHKTGSPTVRRRELGTRLRQLQDGGMTVEQVTDHMLCSPPKVSRMESSADKSAEAEGCA